MLEDVNISIDEGERTCVTGRNGEGKTTLLRIMAGAAEPDRGEVIRAPGLKTAFLSQEAPSDTPGTVFDIVSSGIPESGNKQAAHRFATMLGLRTSDAFNSLSGGMRRRARLAAALAYEPDILLLDEPTNHLDTGTIELLEGILSRLKCACVFVTHDRSFLKNTARRILDLDRGRLTGWECDYSTFLSRKADLLADEDAYWLRKGKKLEREEAWIRRGVKARTTRNEGRVEALRKLREEFSRRRERTAASKLVLGAPQSVSGRQTVKLDNVSFAYPGGEAILNGFSATVLRGERIGVIGPNGSGKTTLLRLMSGQLEPESGSVTLGSGVRIAYFDQLHSSLKPELSVRRNLADDRDEITVNGVSRHIFGYLRDFLFTPDRAETPVSALSGGERARLILAKLFTDPGNLLIMDEPTNDLDVETLELLEEQLSSYDGTVILVSHDRAFLDNVATSSFVLDGHGGVSVFPGGYSDWIQQTSRNKPDTQKNGVSGAPRAESTSNQARRQNRKDRLGYMEQRELSALPGKIAEMENEIAELKKKLEDGSFFVRSPKEAAAEVARLTLQEEELERLIDRWADLESRASASG